MRRRLRCGTCGTTEMKLEDGSVRPLYMLTDNAVVNTLLNNVGECWDCGKKRREAEEAKKQNRLTRLLNDAE